MLKARTESAASAFTALSPRVRNLPPPDIRLMVPKGARQYIGASPSSSDRRRFWPPYDPAPLGRTAGGWSVGRQEGIGSSADSPCKPTLGIGSRGCADVCPTVAASPPRGTGAC